MLDGGSRREGIPTPSSLHRKRIKFFCFFLFTKRRFFLPKIFSLDSSVQLDYISNHAPRTHLPPGPGVRCDHRAPDRRPRRTRGRAPHARAGAARDHSQAGKAVEAAPVHGRRVGLQPNRNQAWGGRPPAAPRPDASQANAATQRSHSFSPPPRRHAQSRRRAARPASAPITSRAHRTSPASPPQRSRTRVPCPDQARLMFQNSGPVASSFPVSDLRHAVGIWNCPRVMVGTWV